MAEQPKFQQLLDQFIGNLFFKRLITSSTITPDEHVYKIATNDGEYYIFEIDYIKNFTYITELLTKSIGDFKYFVEVKQPPSKFENTSPFKTATFYDTPQDFDEFKKYVNDKYGSYEGYFNFLIKI